MSTSERKNLVHKLVTEGYIRSSEVQQAFLQVPRELFVPESLKSHAYADMPLEIGQGQTISAPHMVAIMCEALDVKPGQRILEIGAGSGYHAAVMSYLVGTKGHLYSVDRLPGLAKNAQENLAKAKITNVTVEEGDGSMGLPKYQPYDRIYVTCAAPSVPQPLLDQLQDGGKLLIPVGHMYCDLTLIEKKGNELRSFDYGECVFVPLIGKYGY